MSILGNWMEKWAILARSWILCEFFCLYKANRQNKFMNVYHGWKNLQVLVNQEIFNFWIFLFLSQILHTNNNLSILTYIWKIFLVCNTLVLKIIYCAFIVLELNFFKNFFIIFWHKLWIELCLVDETDFLKIYLY